MLGPLVAVVAYILSGAAAVMDKILLGKRIPSAPAYAFYVGIFGVFALVLAPFGFSLLPIRDLAIALASGALFIFGLLAFYEALERSESSRVVPLVGALVPVFLLVLAWLGYGALITKTQTAAVALFVIGGLWLAPRDGRKPHIPILALSATAAALLAISFLLLGAAFKTSPFISVFIWSRIGSTGAALLLLLLAPIRRAIFSIARGAHATSYALFFLNKGVGAASFFILNYALAVGPMSIVASLKGVEYASVLALAFVLLRKYPHILRESFDSRAILTKIAGGGAIAFGFILLALV